MKYEYILGENAKVRAIQHDLIMEYLTPEQKEILLLYNEQYTKKDMAEKLNISMEELRQRIDSIRCTILDVLTTKILVLQTTPLVNYTGEVKELEKIRIEGE